MTLELRRRPVVLAIEGVIREVVENADCGVFPRPGDAQDIATLRRPPGWRRPRSNLGVRTAPPPFVAAARCPEPFAAASPVGRRDAYSIVALWWPLGEPQRLRGGRRDA